MSNERNHIGLMTHHSSLITGSEATMRPIRVVIGKVGLDGHDRGAKVVARALRDAGMEVIYTGLHHTPEEVVNIALQEDVDAIGISILSGAHGTLLPDVAGLLRERGMEEVLLFAGGIIPQDEIPGLEHAGVDRVFLPGATLAEIVDYVRTTVGTRGNEGRFHHGGTETRGEHGNKLE
jgi:methylmalonyl-CoA mutase C-terminal domain/subunit